MPRVPAARLHARALSSVMLAALTACGGDGGTGPSAPRARSISITAERTIALPGETVQMNAVVVDSTFEPIPDAPVVWSIAEGIGATISSSGLLSVSEAGTVHVRATSGEATTTLAYGVLAPVASISLAGPGGPIAPGTQFRMRRDLRSDGGDELSETYREVSWSSSAPAVATVDDEGTVEIVGPGTATITLTALREATSGSVAVSAEYLVLRDVQPSLFGGCGLDADGRAYCWGGNARGELGSGDRIERPLPWPVATDLRFDSITVGESHACALARADARAWCWGENGDGALGDGTFTTRDLPAPVAGDGAFSAIYAGWNHTCALDAAGGMHCWGRNDWGNFASGDLQGSTVPRAAGSGVTFRSLSLSPNPPSGGPHACGTGTDDVIYCWGRNQTGQGGTGSFTDINDTPTPVVSDQPLASVAVGGHHACGLTTAGLVMCWGSNWGNALGERDLPDFPYSDPVPYPVPDAPTFVSLTATLWQTCGLTAEGSVYCWGDPFGVTPVQIPTAEPLVSIRRPIDSPTGRFCGATADDTTYCWSAGTGSAKAPWHD